MRQTRTICFDGWVLRTDVGELTRNGRKIRLQDQPLQILIELLANPGELVSREQLIARLWPKGIVDFDTGLNSAVRKLRLALEDEAETPRYVETVPRRGYRFIGTLDPQVEQQPQARLLEPAEAADVGGTDAAAAHHRPVRQDLQPPHVARTEVPERPMPPWYRRTHIYAYMAVVVAAVVVALLATDWLRSRPAPTALPAASESAHVPLDDRTVAVLSLGTSANDEVARVLAQSVTDLIRGRLAALEGLVVISTSSTQRLMDSRLDTNAIAGKLHARFLLRGTIERGGDQLHLQVQFVDAASGAELWSAAFDRSANDAAVIMEDIAARVAKAMQVPVEPAAAIGPAPVRINLDSYQLYVRGQQLMSNQRVEDTERALELFRRATILDPDFSRGYLALAQAHLLAGGLRGRDDEVAAEMQAKAETALGRSLELNPTLGEAWIERARLTKDPARSEELFRKALDLAPSYGLGHMRYAEFLFGEYRKGEAIQMMDRARRIDPLNPRLHIRQAFFLMVGRSDVAGHDRLVREALEINPNLHSALVQLAGSRADYSGEFADAIRILEKAITLDPLSSYSRYLAAIAYLDLDDPVAAMATLRDSPQPRGLLEIAQYQRNRQRAAELARSVPPEAWTATEIAPEAEAIRDGAIAAGDYASALKLLEARYATDGGPARGLRMWNRGLGLVYAHTLTLAGQVERGRKLATSIMVQLDSESVGRTEHWFSRERAAVFAILGEDERALDELEAGLKLNRFTRWWYLAELDPLYDRLRSHPRFVALVKQAQRHRAQQRVLLEEMRRRGEVPRRVS